MRQLSHGYFLRRSRVLVHIWTGRGGILLLSTMAWSLMPTLPESGRVPILLKWTLSRKQKRKEKKTRNVLEFIAVPPENPLFISNSLRFPNQ